MTFATFIKKRPYLIWWVKDYNKLDTESIVGATLNYGDWDDVQTLIKMLGMKKAAKIFREKSKRSTMGQSDYFPEIILYFNFYFNKHVPPAVGRKVLVGPRETWKSMQ